MQFSTIKLQSVGEVKAVKADSLQIGDVTLWNFGSKARVVGIDSKKQTRCFTVVDLECLESGELHSRKLKKDRLVGIESTPEQEAIALVEVVKAIKTVTQSRDVFTSSAIVLATPFDVRELYRPHMFRAFRMLVTAGYLREVHEEAKKGVLQIASKYEVARELPKTER